MRIFVCLVSLMGLCFAACGNLEFFPFYFSPRAVGFFIDLPSICLMIITLSLLLVGGFGITDVIEGIRVCIQSESTSQQNAETLRMLAYLSSSVVWCGLFWSLLGLISMLQYLPDIAAEDAKRLSVASGIILLPILYAVGLYLVFQMLAACIERKNQTPS